MCCTCLFLYRVARELPLEHVMIHPLHSGVRKLLIALTTDGWCTAQSSDSKGDRFPVGPAPLPNDKSVAQDIVAQQISAALTRACVCGQA